MKSRGLLVGVNLVLGRGGVGDDVGDVGGGGQGWNRSGGDGGGGGGGGGGANGAAHEYLRVGIRF